MINNILKTLVWFFLMIVSLVLLTVLSIPMFLASLFFKKLLLNNNLKNYLKRITITIDILGNVICGGVFNKLFLKNKLTTKKFGKMHETVSYVIGLNLVDGNLNHLGVLVVILLNAIDDNHCLKAISYHEARFNNLKQK